MLKVLKLSYKLLVNCVSFIEKFGRKKECLQYPGYRPIIH